MQKIQTQVPKSAIIRTVCHSNSVSLLVLYLHYCPVIATPTRVSEIYHYIIPSSCCVKQWQSELTHCIWPGYITPLEWAHCTVQSMNQWNGESPSRDLLLSLNHLLENGMDEYWRLEMQLLIFLIIKITCYLSSNTW